MYNDWLYCILSTARGFKKFASKGGGVILIFYLPRGRVKVVIITNMEQKQKSA